MFALLVCIVASFGVFVVPFFFPPGFTSVVSVSNAAGFNNKVAAMLAAACAVFVFMVTARNLSAYSIQGPPKECKVQSRHEQLSYWNQWVLAGLTLCSLIAFAAWQVHVSGLLYPGDVGYFVNQMRSSAEYNRSLYSEIEFPYGQMLFYPPILLYSALRHSHYSLQTCYFIVLVLNQFLGVMLLGYVVSKLPMGRTWRSFVLFCFVPFTLQPMLGFNYTWFRFVIPFATFLFCAGERKVSTTSLFLSLGVVLNLAVSPEIGFAFAAGSIAYSLLQIHSRGRQWALSLASAPFGGAAFLLLAGQPYWRMFGLFANGGFNFIVEPLPHILLYLVALIWLVPRLLAINWPKIEKEGVILTSCFVMGISLTPVALGRADPAHVFFNGLIIFLLSFVAVSRCRSWQQVCWGTLVAGAMLFGFAREMALYKDEVLEVLCTNAALHPTWPVSQIVLRTAKAAGSERISSLVRGTAEPKLDMEALESITGGAGVATPFGIGPHAEEQLQERGLYRPDFYFGMTAVLDQQAEEHKIDILDNAAWALVPTSEIFNHTETQQLENAIMGIPLNYSAKRAPYSAGPLVRQELQFRWKPVAALGPYTLYRNNAAR